VGSTKASSTKRRRKGSGAERVRRKRELVWLKPKVLDIRYAISAAKSLPGGWGLDTVVEWGSGWSGGMADRKSHGMPVGGAAKSVQPDTGDLVSPLQSIGCHRG